VLNFSRAGVRVSKKEILADGAGEEIRVLVDKSNLPAELGKVIGGNGVEANSDGAAGGIPEARNELEKGSFARTAGAGEGNPAASRNVKGKLVEGER
jgi:hypothetical protein